MSSLQKISFLLACVPVLFLGLGIFHNVVLAQSSPSNPPTTPSSPAGNGKMDPVELKNPLRVGSLEALLVAILNIFITLMIPVIVFFIILAGFKYVTAQGNPHAIEEATTTFTYAVIGGVLILAAVAIAEIIKNTVAAF
jgi:hypothetical protein